MRKILINQTAFDVDIFDTGIPIPADGSYEISPQDHLIWVASVDVINHIVAGDLKVSDGENILPIRVGISLIQNNYIVLNEFYTLVQDDDVLIGNGQILNLYDQSYNTENVPAYMDEPVDDDVPVEE